MSAVLTIAMLRDFLDDSVLDIPNKRSGDLLWTDPELQYGLEHAARAYNSQPPTTIRINAAQLPADSLLFFNGAAAAVFGKRLRSLLVEQQQFEAGGIATNPDALMIAGLTKLRDESQQAFEAEARIRKNQINLSKCIFSF